MQYDIQEDAFRIPVQIENREALISATALDREIRQRVAPIVADELQKRIPQIAQAVLDCGAREYPVLARAGALRPAETPLQEAAREWGERYAPTAREGLEKQRAAEGQSTVPPSTDASGHSVRFTMRMPPTWLMRISRLAREQGADPTDVVRRLVLEGLNRTSEQAPQIDEQLGRYEIRVQGETRRLLEEEFAAPGGALSRYDILNQALALGLRVLRNRSVAPPKVARADIPAEYEYDPSTDSYRRGSVHTLLPPKVDRYIAIRRGGVAVLRNETGGDIDLHLKSRFEGVE